MKQAPKTMVQKGFTLIELMIVVAIIGILAAIAIPSYRDYTIKAKIGKGVADLAGQKIKVGEAYDVTNALGCTDGANTIPNCAGAGILSTTNGGVTVTITPAAPAALGGDITWSCVPTGNNGVVIKGCGLAI